MVAKDYPRLFATVALAGCLAFALLELGQTLFRSDHGFAEPMSDYAVGRYGYLQTIAFAALGLASLALCAALSPPQGSASAWSTGRLLLAIWSMGVLLAAIFPVDAGEPSGAGQVHGVASGVSFIAVVVAMFVLSTAFGHAPRWASFSRLSSKLSGTAALALVVAGPTQRSLAFGVAQRVFVGTVVAWLIITAFRLRSMPTGAPLAGPR